MDDIAKRAVPFGGMAEGTARMVAWRSSLAEYPANAVADAILAHPTMAEGLSALFSEVPPSSAD